MKPFEVEFGECQAFENCVRMEVSGSLDADSVQEFNERIETLLEDRPRHVALVIAGLTYVSSAGIGSIMGLAQRLRAHGGELFLVRPTAKVFKILDLLGLTKVLIVAESMEDAIRQHEEAETLIGEGRPSRRRT